MQQKLKTEKPLTQSHVIDFQKAAFLVAVLLFLKDTDVIKI